MAEPQRPGVSADQVIQLMDAAARASAADPSRTGFLVELPAEGEAFITGDLHGNEANLRRIIALANLPRFRQRHLILQELVHELHGEEDVCRSYRLVETAARLKLAFPDQVHLLLGNHEFSEVTHLEIGKRGRELNLAFDEGLRVCYGERWEDVKSAYSRLWRASPLAIRTASRIFISHSTPRGEKVKDIDLQYLRTVPSDEVFQRDGPVFALLWGRDYRPESAEAFARRVDADVLVVGHTTCEDGVRLPNDRHIILDCKDLNASYALVPLDRTLSQRELLAYVRKLYAGCM